MYKAVLIVIISLLLLSSCKQQAASPLPSVSVEQVSDDISVSSAKKLLANTEYTFLDVRTPGEIKDGKINGAIELDYNSPDFEKDLTKLPKDKNYIVYCKSGGRSARSQKLMKKLGFTNTLNMLGGYSAWNSK